ncbi:hypothetical protein PLICRDRAFT_35466 [Plicaturopsis crispa FD-325 SS-3]|nr:hypothetical protein PLICRDRAFT_35466 [Plicaturopsis crispa FD-325 SS-3]
MSINGSSSKPTAGADDMSADIAQLSALLSEDPPANGSENEVAELLRRLNSAEGMAQGVESRLDEMLENLDNLLKTLDPEVAEPKDGNGKSLAK